MSNESRTELSQQMITHNYNVTRLQKLETLRKRLENLDRTDELTDTIQLCPGLKGSFARPRLIQLWRDMYDYLADELGVGYSFDEDAIADGKLEVGVTFTPKQVNPEDGDTSASL